MHRVCERLLEPPISDTPLNLEEIIVNLSISELSNMVTSYRYSQRCRAISGDTFVQLKEAMEN